MKYSFEARMEAHDNRRKIIDNNVNGAIEELEAYIDRAIEKGRFEFSADESKFLENFDVEIKEEITNHLSTYGYKVDWCNYTITISFEEG